MVSFTVLSGNAQLTRMLRSLANIFHYTIRKPGAIVSLHEELNYVQVETDQETVTIRVTNDGPGMTPDACGRSTTISGWTRIVAPKKV